MNQITLPSFLRSAPPRCALLLGALVLSGCQTPARQAPAATAVTISDAEPPGPAWLSLLQPADRDQMLRIDEAWTEGLAAARRAGFTRRIRAEGPLLDPAAALPRAAPAPGSYRCRFIRLGSPVRRRAYVSETPSFCYVGVEGQLLSLTKQTGSPRPGGYLHEDSDTRLIFIGATAQRDEDVPPPYGDDPSRNVSGVFERVGPFRYRLVVPRPASGSAVDVLELTPAPSQGD